MEMLEATNPWGSAEDQGDAAGSVRASGKDWGGIDGSILRADGALDLSDWTKPDPATVAAKLRAAFGG